MAKPFEARVHLRKDDFKDLSNYHLDMWKALMQDLGIEAYEGVDEIEVYIKVIAMSRPNGKRITTGLEPN